MNQKDYLNKVVEQLVSETTIEGRIVWVPYSVLHQTLNSFLSPFLSPYLLSLFSSFSSYVRNVYGLTEEEVKYVWEQYRSIIHDKI